MLEKGAQVRHGPVTIDHAVELRVDDKDHRSALDVVMTQPLIDRFAVGPLDWIAKFWHVLAILSPDLVFYLQALLDLHFFLNDELDGF